MSCRQPRRVFFGLIPALLGLAGCACPDRPDALRPESPEILPRVSAAAEGDFVGSISCATCHESEFGRWERSRHRSSTRIVDPERDRLGSFGSGVFRMAGDGTGFGPGPGGSEVRVEAAYLVKGRSREDLWVRLQDGRLQVWPVSRDLRGRESFEPLARVSLGRSPSPSSVHFWLAMGRNAGFGCYGCHSTAATLTRSGTTASGNPVPVVRWVEPGVGCEACHGPGGAHVARALAGESPTEYGPGSPAKSCESCHVLRELLDSPFDPEPAHPYGTEPWHNADPAVAMPSNLEFREALHPDMRPATYQQQGIALAQSGCARRGGLGCGHCHDPHGGEDPMDSDGGLDSICGGCHGEISADREAHTGHSAHSPGARCRACHLAPVLRGPASEPATDHSLAPPVAFQGEFPAACAVCHPDGEHDGVPLPLPSARSNGARRRIRIREAIEASMAGHPDAGDRLAALASDTEEAWFIRWASLRRLADLPLEGGSNAMRRAARLAADDSNPALRRMGLRVIGLWGAPSDAGILLERAGGASIQEAAVAATALIDLGEPEAGARMAAFLDHPAASGLYRAHNALGVLALRSRHWEIAERALSHSIEVHPIQVSVLNDWGVALWSLGRVDDAREAWRRALEWNPGYEAARRNLAEPGP